MDQSEQLGQAFEVPVIDLSGFRAGTPAQRAEVAAQVDRAGREVGFLNIVGHGVPGPVVDGLGSAIDAFFALPAATKNALRPPSPSINRGYTGPRTEHLSYSLGVVSAPDLFEAFNVGTQASDWPGLALPTEHYPENLWPELPGFRAAVEAWFGEAGRVARELTEVFAVALGLPSGYFAGFTDHSIDVLRMNCFSLPSGDVRVEVDQMGMGAHTDYGIVTVLWADPISPGLQVLDAAGGWHDVVPAPGACWSTWVTRLPAGPTTGGCPRCTGCCRRWMRTAGRCGAARRPTSTTATPRPSSPACRDAPAPTTRLAISR